MHKQNGYVAFGLWMLVVAVIGIGWVMNILALVKMSFSPVTIELVLRIVGIFLAPLGTIMGYFV